MKYILTVEFDEDTSDLSLDYLEEAIEQADGHVTGAVEV